MNCISKNYFPKQTIFKYEKNNIVATYGSFIIVL
jgi:hypothetical protein